MTEIQVQNEFLIQNKFEYNQTNYFDFSNPIMTIIDINTNQH